MKEHIESELKQKFTDPFLNGMRQNDDSFCGVKLLLKNTEKLYELSIVDRYYDYPFFKDLECDNEKGILAEHERVENFIYSTNILYLNSYCHLYKLINNYLRPFRDSGVYRDSVIDVGLVLLPGDFMINLCSSLDVLSLLVAFIQGYPANVYSSNMKQVMLLLENICDREESVFVNDSLRWDTTSLSDDHREKSTHLITNLLPTIITDEGINWLEEIYKYRNYFAHKNFTAKVIRRNREVYIPKSPNILPSVVLNADERNVMNYCHPLPLDIFCVDRYKRTRMLIEKTFECLIETYEWRLENPDRIVNPHNVFRGLNSYS